MQAFPCSYISCLKKKRKVLSEYPTVVLVLVYWLGPTEYVPPEVTNRMQFPECRDLNKNRMFDNAQNAIFDSMKIA
jgi:hypothetical protein